MHWFLSNIVCSCTFFQILYLLILYFLHHQDGEVIYDDPKVDARVKAEREKTKKSPTIPSSAPKSKGGQGLLGGGPGKIKDDSKEATQFKERFSKQKSQQQLQQERNQMLKDLDKGINKQTTKSTTKTTPSKSSSSGSFKRPSFTKSSGGYTRKYTGGR